jgi:hypothetical protein
MLHSLARGIVPLNWSNASIGFSGNAVQSLTGLPFSSLRASPHTGRTCDIRVPSILTHVMLNKLSKLPQFNRLADKFKEKVSILFNKVLKSCFLRLW